MTTDRAGTLGAILLAGGRASRMGGVPKPLLDVGGRSMLQAAIDVSLAIGCSPVTVVGPAPDPQSLASRAQSSLPPGTSSSLASGALSSLSPGASSILASGALLLPPIADAAVTWTREDPPFAGPAAAVVAALHGWDHDPDWTFVLACDLPRIDAAVMRLRDDMMLLPSDTDGMCLADESSRPQWLTGVYRTSALRRAADAVSDSGKDASMRTLLDGLAIAVIAASGDVTADIDTWEDFERFRHG